MPADCLIRPLREADLSTASAICRRAFATFMRVPDPQTFWTDREYVRTRWRADPDAALAAEVNGALVGSNFATRWGRFAFFGPLTVTPELWNQGIAHQLMTATIDLIDSWNVTAAGSSRSPTARPHPPVPEVRLLASVLDRAARQDSRRAGDRLVHQALAGRSR
ncbi:hypothetical protein BZL29_6297 [Mycobacterium kansasii]|uniref:N-acetyltransferase domain-containing protein n=1 Tax=Mycobacterium kansasii TaxID=1768 RepID=A0A1V3WSQ6_MYCKA|nr:hypothetical protein BZL29_6297 [Mycobacterium kansasii]